MRLRTVSLRPQVVVRIECGELLTSMVRQRIARRSRVIAQHVQGVLLSLAGDRKGGVRCVAHFTVRVFQLDA